MAYQVITCFYYYFRDRHTFSIIISYNILWLFAHFEACYVFIYLYNGVKSVNLSTCINHRLAFSVCMCVVLLCVMILVSQMNCPLGTIQEVIIRYGMFSYTLIKDLKKSLLYFFKEEKHLWSRILCWLTT